MNTIHYSPKNDCTHLKRWWGTRIWNLPSCCFESVQCGSDSDKTVLHTCISFASSGKENKMTLFYSQYNASYNTVSQKVLFTYYNSSRPLSQIWYLLMISFFDVRCLCFCLGHSPSPKWFSCWRRSSEIRRLGH